MLSTLSGYSRSSSISYEIVKKTQRLLYVLVQFDYYRVVGISSYLPTYLLTTRWRHDTVTSQLPAACQLNWAVSRATASVAGE